jgi:hypothetical protein
MVSTKVKSVIWAFCETGLTVIPILVWGVTLLSIGQDAQIWKLPAWSFLSVSIFVIVLRDGLKAFHREADKQDKFSQDIIVSLSVLGMVIGSVLLTLAVLYSQQQIQEPWKFFYHATYVLLLVSLVLLFFVKSISFQRAEGLYA